MRSTLRQRLPCARRFFGALAALLALQALAPMRAGAVQIFIESAFVHRNNRNCVAVENQFGIIRFRCPPIPQTVGLGSIIPSGNNDTNPGDPDFCLAGSAACGNRVPSVGPCEFPLGAAAGFIGGFAAVPADGVSTQDVCATGGVERGFGNISNDPQIQFERDVDASVCSARFGVSPFTGTGVDPFKRGMIYTNVCNANLFLCGSVGYGTNDTSAATAIDEISFEIFKFQDGSNPLDEGSTPPLRTFFIDAPGALPGFTVSDSSGPLGPFCVLWDGSVNIQGEFGKTNGQFGFRAKTKTNQTGASGNIQITAVRAYPSGATRDADGSCGDEGCIVSQKPITVDVTNVHVIRSSPSLVGTITPVPSEPYNIFYRLSKDATMFINITSVDSANNVSRLRTVLNGLTRVGEGTPIGSLSNGDSWNGRSDNGDFAPPGNYLAVLQAVSVDQFGYDLSEATTRQIGLDPLQITDIRVQPLLEGATSLAVLDYVLTEPATVYIEVYPPSTQFCRLFANVNDFALDGSSSLQPKDFMARSSSCSGPVVSPLKHIVEQKPGRVRGISFWDGRDESGQIVPDGDYIFLIYASLPSQNGSKFTVDGTTRIWTSQAKSGFLPVIRGFVGISQVTPASSVIGSSPSVAGLNPFLFRYSLSRDAIVNLKVFDSTGLRLVKTLVRNEQRPGLFGNVDRWDEATDDQGLVVDSGTYLVQLTAADPLEPSKVSTTTASFPINLFRITDIQTTPLLSGASDVINISYQLSQPMIVWLNIYPPGTIIKRTTQEWPPCSISAPGFPAPVCSDIVTPGGATAQPVISIKGLRGGRLRITEQWDGRDSNGLLSPDGQYVFVLTAQSTTTPIHFPTDKIFGTLTVQRGAILFPSFTVIPDIPTLFNSSNTITLHPFSIQYSLTRQSSVTIQILNTNLPPQVIRTVISGAVRQNGILLTDVWDGRDDRGNFPPSAFYIVRAVATDIAAALSSGSTAQVTISYDPLRIYDVAVSPIHLDSSGSTLFYQVSEPMKVAVKIYKPGTSFDQSGNSNPPENISLVKRIVGVKPARVQIEDVWDGTDLRLSIVPDGSYKFKIVGSTDVRAIDDVTGNVLNPGALSLDRPVDEIPVVRNASSDPLGDFERNTFVFPNPVTTSQATFQIYVPFQAKVNMRLYNIAGELVLDKSFGEQAPSFTSVGSLMYTWARVNQSGRSVARGLYYAVVRVEESLGGKTVLQTVKRFVIP